MKKQGSQKRSSSKDKEDRFYSYLGGKIYRTRD